MIQSTLAEALDRALTLLAAGHDVGYCLRQFPDHARELAPLLAMSEALYLLADEARQSWEQRADRSEPDWHTLLANVTSDTLHDQTAHQMSKER